MSISIVWSRTDKGRVRVSKREWYFQGDRPEYTLIREFEIEELYRFVHGIQKEFAKDFEELETCRLETAKQNEIRLRAEIRDMVIKDYQDAVREYPDEPKEFYVGMIIRDFDSRWTGLVREVIDAQHG